MSAATRPLFTIGHSHHSIDALLALLARHGVTAVADVRSHPYSRRLEQFNRESLTAELAAVGIRYVFLGEELGARRTEAECYIDDRADYSRIAELPKFQEGLQRLRQGAAEHQIALLCAEQEPLDCHRTILICRQLRGEFDILHIMPDGELERHADTERRLVREMNVFRTLFEPDASDEQLISQAYEKRAEQIAYRVAEEGAAP